MANKINKLMLLGCLALTFASCEDIPEVENNIPTLISIQTADVEAETVVLYAHATSNTKYSYFLLSETKDMENPRYYDAICNVSEETGYDYRAYPYGLEPGVEYYYQFVLVNNYDSDMRIESKVMSFVTDTQYRQRIIWNTSYSGTYLGDEPITLNATATSGLPVSYKIIEGDCARLEGNHGQSLVILSNGTVVVQATQEGNDWYHAAEPLNKSITIKDNKLIISDVIVDDWGANSAGSSNVEI